MKPNIDSKSTNICKQCGKTLLKQVVVCNKCNSYLADTDRSCWSDYSVESISTTASTEIKAAKTARLRKEQEDSKLEFWQRPTPDLLEIFSRIKMPIISVSISIRILLMLSAAIALGYLYDVVLSGLLALR